MSYNIDSIEVIAADNFRLDLDVRDALAESIGDDAPEINIFEYDRADGATHISFRQGASLQWSGEGSGHAFDVLVGKVLPRFEGSADLLVTWEGGDSFSGLRIRDGKVTRHKIIHALGDEVKE